MFWTLSRQRIQHALKENTKRCCVQGVERKRVKAGMLGVLMSLVGKNVISFPFECEIRRGGF